jgi:hypothetical protein
MPDPTPPMEDLASWNRALNSEEVRAWHDQSRRPQVGIDWWCHGNAPLESPWIDGDGQPVIRNLWGRGWPAAAQIEQSRTDRALPPAVTAAELREALRNVPAEPPHIYPQQPTLLVNEQTRQDLLRWGETDPGAEVTFRNGSTMSVRAPLTSADEVRGLRWDPALDMADEYEELRSIWEAAEAVQEQILQDAAVPAQLYGRSISANNYRVAAMPRAAENALAAYTRRSVTEQRFVSQILPPLEPIQLQDMDRYVQRQEFRVEFFAWTTVGATVVNPGVLDFDLYDGDEFEVPPAPLYLPVQLGRRLGREFAGDTPVPDLPPLPVLETPAWYDPHNRRFLLPVFNLTGTAVVRVFAIDEGELAPLEAQPTFVELRRLCTEAFDRRIGRSGSFCRVHLEDRALRVRHCEPAPFAPREYLERQIRQFGLQACPADRPTARAIRANYTPATPGTLRRLGREFLEEIS